jgi:hypothetical protein
MNLEERMKKRQADFEVAIAWDHVRFKDELLIMYRGWGSDVAEEFLKSLAGTILDPDQHMDFAKKIARERLGNGFIKFASENSICWRQLKNASMRGSPKGEVDPSLQGSSFSMAM